MFSIDNTRKDFPILNREVYGKPLVYLDSAASSQKPKQVIESIKKFEENDYANVHRGIHFLSNASTYFFHLKLLLCQPCKHRITFSPLPHLYWATRFPSKSTNDIWPDFRNSYWYLFNLSGKG